MNKKYIYLKAFTLVELIVVVTILAILATIGFVSYSSYLTGVRDTNRLAQLVSLHDGLELYRTKKDLPLPDDSVEVKNNGELIAYQGYTGKNTLETIGFTKGGKDPKDNQYFSYYLTKNRKYFQLLAFLEEKENLQAYNKSTPSLIFPGNLYKGGATANALDYSNRTTTVYGKKLGILTNEANIPIQEITSIMTTGGLDLTATTDGYRAHVSDDLILTGATANSYLQYLGHIGIAGGVATNCKTLIDRNSSMFGKDGIYVVAPEGKDAFPVYCDMTTDNGGWTLVMRGKSGNITGWYTAGDLNLQHSLMIGDTFKFANTKINNLKTKAYRIIKNNEPCG